MAKKKAYSVNHASKVITFDSTVELTTEEQKILDFYAKGGYKIKPKSQARAKIASKRASDNGIYTAEYIRHDLGKDKKALDKFEELCKHGFFKGRKFYIEWLSIQKIKEEMECDKDALKQFLDISEYNYEACMKYYNDWKSKNKVSNTEDTKIEDTKTDETKETTKKRSRATIKPEIEQ